MTTLGESVNPSALGCRAGNGQYAKMAKIRHPASHVVWHF